MIGATLDDFARRDWQAVEAPAEPRRVAVIGLGWFSREHAIPALEDATFCRLGLGVDPSPANRRRTREAREVATLTPEEFHDGARADRYDALYVAAPNRFHLEYVRTAAELAKPVLCEKPMEKDVERSRAMVEAADAAGIALMIGYRMQVEPAVRRMRELLRAGAIGRPELVHSSVSQHLLSIEPDPDQWRLDPELSGGGAMINLGLYPLNTTRFLLDDDPTSVEARTVSRHPAFERVEEKAAFQLAFPGGTLACGTAQETAHRASHLTVVGEEGRMRLDPAYAPWRTLRLTVEAGGRVWTVEREGGNQLTEQFDYFGHALETGADPAPDGAHALVDMEVVEEIYARAGPPPWPRGSFHTPARPGRGRPGES